MNPSQIGAVGQGATVGGGILSAFGSLSQGTSNKNMYDYQAALARMNAQIDQQNAEFAMQTGNQQNMQFGLKAGQRLGQIKAAQAASGFAVNSGSAKQVVDSQQQLDKIDMATIRSNAAKTAYNYEVKGTMDESQAGLYETAGKQSMVAGEVGAMSSFLGTAGSVSNQWLQAKQSGLYGGASAGSSDYWSLFQ